MYSLEADLRSQFDILLRFFCSLLIIFFVVKIILDTIWGGKYSLQPRGNNDSNYKRYERKASKRTRINERRARLVAQRWQLTKVNIEYINNSEIDDKEPFSPDSSFEKAMNYEASFEVPIYEPEQEFSTEDTFAMAQGA